MAYSLECWIYFRAYFGDTMNPIIIILVIWALALMAVRRMP
jgi:hypothetical protein